MIKNGKFKKCVQCGNKIYVIPSEKQKKLCSRKCYYKYSIGKKKRKIGWYKKCFVCNGEFYITPSKKRQSFCSRECYYKDYSNKKIGKCLGCLKRFEYYNQKLFCSIKCYAKSKIGKPSGMLGKSQSQKAKEMISKKKKGVNLSIETRERMRKTWKKLFENPQFKEKTLKKMQEGLERKPNKPENIVINLIQQNNLNFIYTGNGDKWISYKGNIFNPDFVSKDNKLIIEVFGNYWHKLPEAIDRDKIRLKTYSRYGYKTLIIWEHELLDKTQVLNKINSFIK